ncbi:MAG: YdeI/OmpD-associated family protein, partial [Chryseobacterium sp.]|uniref:YdeI/OmpD-associated family protein n=1 Tax=Chryseobacterium sp. TaxID=1871047 RepID=UPI001B262D34
GVTLKKAAPTKTEIAVPDEFQNVLDLNKKALDIFQNASPSFRKEYINWIMEAKTETTRNKRMEQAIEWISEGKGRNWKYEKKK